VEFLLEAREENMWERLAGTWKAVAFPQRNVVGSLAEVEENDMREWRVDIQKVAEILPSSTAGFLLEVGVNDM